MNHFKIELRSTELNDIQAKCKKADSEDRVEQRWSSCHSLVEAKIALKHIFSLVMLTLSFKVYFVTHHY